MLGGYLSIDDLFIDNLLLLFLYQFDELGLLAIRSYPLPNFFTLLEENNIREVIFNIYTFLVVALSVNKELRFAVGFIIGLTAIPQLVLFLFIDPYHCAIVTLTLVAEVIVDIISTLHLVVFGNRLDVAFVI